MGNGSLRFRETLHGAHRLSDLPSSPFESSKSSRRRIEREKEREKNKLTRLYAIKK